MKMTKTQLKEAVKAVVRECLNERVIKEVAPPGGMEEQGVQGADGKVSVVDDIVRFVLRKAPAIRVNADKVAKVTALLFHHQFGKVADMDAVQQAVERNLDYEDQAGNTQVSDTPEKPKAAKKSSVPAAGGTEEDENKSEPEESHEEEESKSEPSEEEESQSEDEESVNEVAAKTLPPNKAQYKVATARQYTTTDQNKALTIQTDPKVNESETNTLPPNKGQYKVVPPHQYTTTAQNKALTRQSDPKVNEAGLTSEKTPDMRLSSLVKKKKGIAKENHKVQARSFKTVNDLAQDPNIVRDPEVPMSESNEDSSFPACHHSHYTLKDDGQYECTNCGKIRGSK